MSDRLLHRREVERLTGLSRASIYRLMGMEGSLGLWRDTVHGVRWKEGDITT